MMTASNLRIVSLLPSATEIVAALGLTDAIVGRSANAPLR
jgi:iron complex transport system substrate-binding protein